MGSAASRPAVEQSTPRQPSKSASPSPVLSTKELSSRSEEEEDDDQPRAGDALPSDGLFADRSASSLDSSLDVADSDLRSRDAAQSLSLRQAALRFALEKSRRGGQSKAVSLAEVQGEGDVEREVASIRIDLPASLVAADVAAATHAAVDIARALVPSQSVEEVLGPPAESPKDSSPSMSAQHLSVDDMWGASALSTQYQPVEAASEDVEMSEVEEGETSPVWQGARSDLNSFNSLVESPGQRPATPSPQSDHMDIDYGSSDQDEDSSVYQEYISTLHLLLAWGIPPISLLQHGVSAYDIRRVLMPHYLATPPPPPITTPPPTPPPPAVPAILPSLSPPSPSTRPAAALPTLPTPPTPTPPAEEAPTRLTIHSQYKPTVDRKYNVSSPASGIFPGSSSASQSTGNARSGVAKQKNWDAPYEAAVILRYDSRSPSPPPAHVELRPTSSQAQQPTQLMYGTTTASFSGLGYSPNPTSELAATVSSSSVDAASNALSDAQASRQAALESLRARKRALADAVGSAREASGTPIASLDVESQTPYVIPAAVVTLEREVTAEAVVHGAKSLTHAEDDVVLVEERSNLEQSEEMEMEEEEEDGEVAEEGEISELDAEPMVTQQGSSASPQVFRGIKRPVASDFEAQPASKALLPTTLRSRRRGLFGGAARRAAHLVIELSDTSDTEDEDAPTTASRSRVDSEAETRKQRLAETEDKLREARERLDEAIRQKRATRRAAAYTPSATSEGAHLPTMTGQALLDQVSLRAPDEFRVADYQVPTLASVQSDDSQPLKAADEEASLEGIEPTTNDGDDNQPPASSTNISVSSHLLATTYVLNSTQHNLTTQPTTDHPLAVAFSPAHFFSPYHSLLGGYPLQTRYQSTSQPSAATDELRVDEGLMSSIVLTRVMRDPASRLCTYELSGVCSDASCSSVHPSRDLQVTDSDLIAYLSRTMLPTVSTSQLSFVIQESRRNQPSQPSLLTSLPSIQAILSDAVAILGLA